jgi:cell wall-associated NlpC family hydrolase
MAPVAFSEYADLLALPFKRGGRGPAFYDCYGAVKEMFRRDGIELPDFESPGSLEEIESLVETVPQGPRWRPVHIGTPRALITFRVDGVGAHVGYHLGNDRFLHALESTGVTTERLTGNPMRPLASYRYE